MNFGVIRFRLILCSLVVLYFSPSILQVVLKIIKNCNPCCSTIRLKGVLGAELVKQANMLHLKGGQ